MKGGGAIGGARVHRGLCDGTHGTGHTSAGVLQCLAVSCLPWPMLCLSPLPAGQGRPPQARAVTRAAIIHPLLDRSTHAGCACKKECCMCKTDDY